MATHTPEARFTPGEWKNRTVGDPTATSGKQIYANGLHVATAHYGHSVDVSTAVGNAQLIAAAPDLYAALKRAQARLKELGDTDAVGSPLWSIRAALAKAAPHA